MAFDDATLVEALSPKRFHLILLPTEKCNFRCTYCYEDFAIGRMSQAVVSGVKRLLETRISTLDCLGVSWFGGEPLLAKDIMFDVGTFAHNLCAEHGVSFASHTTTNGYLLDADSFRRFLDISHNEFQITLDGDEEWHDKTRLLANRRATFKTIWSNLESYRKVEGKYRITLRLHIHRENIESVKRLYTRLSRELLDDPRFGVFFHRVSPLGQRPIDEVELDERTYLEAIAYITDKKSTDCPDGGGISEFHLNGYICYAAKPNSLLIRANGRLAKCTVAFNDERNDIGHLNEDGTLEVANEKLRKWFAGFGTLSEKTLGCPLSTLERSAPGPIESPVTFRPRLAQLGNA